MKLNEALKSPYLNPVPLISTTKKQTKLQKSTRSIEAKQTSNQNTHRTTYLEVPHVILKPKPIKLRPLVTFAYGIKITHSSTNWYPHPFTKKNI